MVEGVHDGLSGRDADQREGAGDAALHTAEVWAISLLKIKIFSFRENGQIVADLIFTAFDKVMESTVPWSLHL